ncbi:Trimeric GatFAB AmidoTransferase(AdT) complex subunit [Orbilia brochopaga]|uniref:Glutamyl-tRNA(Gln) amidotransferase subunit A, mitochondrial n=1 Tax=Orbilia brochopaga TaxID=3140254 RepID=A0AAV9UMW6_9PEZI
MPAARDAARCLQAVSQHNGLLNALVHIRPPAAVLADANAASRAPVSGTGDSPRSSLDGLLFAIKDNLCTSNMPTSCASRMLADFHPQYDATVVARLKARGAVLLGKTNMDEFGMGSDSVHSCFGPVKNPLSSEHSAGGSSGGSAAAVASGMCFGALGSDTGGSIRLPASYCGVVGFKPSHGLLSRRGLIAYANSLDTVGIVASDVSSVRLIYDSLKEHDESDPTSVDNATRRRIEDQAAAFRSSRGGQKRHWRIGVPMDYNVSEISTRLREAWVSTLAALRDLGHQIVPVDLPSTRHAVCSYYIVALAEASSNLAKYDGIRFGLSPTIAPTEAKTNPLAKITAAREQGFGKEVQRRILLGNYSLTSEAMENYFIHAQKVRRMVKQDFDRVFAFPNPLNSTSKTHQPDPPKEPVDVLISPVSVSSAPALQDVTSLDRSALDAYINDVFTIPASMAGLPALSVPIPASTDGELPLGLQIIAQYGDEDSLFDIATVVEDL